ncbi:MAG: hypothetical protein KDC80_14105 [Saprospiraceae bacterium]|nr:hypothetical protein [Saprospiraceae bacterium]
MMPDHLNKLQTTLTALFFCLFYISIFPQPNYRFEHLGMEDGLTDEDIYSITQDSTGFIWISTPSGLNRYDGMEVTKLRYDPDLRSGTFPGVIYKTQVDRSGKIWFSGGFPNGLFIYNPVTGDISDTDLHAYMDVLYFDKRGNFWAGINKGLFRIDTACREMISFATEFGKEFDARWVNAILEDHSGDMWFGGSGILFQYDWANDTLISHLEYIDETGIINDNRSFTINSLYEDSRHNIWAGTTAGLFRFDTIKHRFLPFSLLPQDPDKRFFISSIVESGDEKLWIGDGVNGLFVVDLDDHGVEKISLFSGDYSSNNIKCLFRDLSGDIWIGTGNAGVFYWSGQQKDFQIIDEPVGVGSRKADNISSIAADKQGHLWIIDGGYLRFFDTERRKFEGKATHLPYLPDGRITVDTGGALWIATAGEGLIWYDPPQNQYRQYKHDPDNQGSIPNNQIRSIVRWGDEIFINAAARPLTKFNPKTSQFSIAELGNRAETIFPGHIKLFVDQSGHLWIPGWSELYHVRNGRSSIDTLPINVCNDFQMDEEGFLWIATGVGICRIDPQSGDSKCWSERHGLANNRVHSILGSKEGEFWLGTNHGLSCFNAKTETFRNFDLADGLPGTKFRLTAAAISSSGEYYFGTYHGLVAFHPDSIKDNPVEPPVVLTDFFINQQHISSDSGTVTSPLSAHVAFTEEIKLKWHQNNISFKFVALSFLHAEKNKYQYRLLNYDDSWTETDAFQRTAHYTNLDPGHYTFQVKGTNNDGIGSEIPTSIEISIVPPWWETKVAYLAYFLIVVFILRSIVRYQVRRERNRVETKRLKDLNDFKDRFYTNLTHELRTPLTVIQGMVSQIRKNPQKWYSEGLAMIERNSNNLQSVIRQILDLSRIESGALPIRMQQADMVSFLGYLMQSFQGFADHAGLKLHYLKKVNNIMMDFDPEKIKTIIKNLTSNAIKFTPKGGDIYVVVDQVENDLVLEIRDTGVGIGQEELNQIFDRFYQVSKSNDGTNTGTGIGLTLTRELVKIFEGTISVKSEVNFGTTFTVRLPITNNAPLESIDAESYNDSDITSPAPTHYPSAKKGLKDSPLV